MSKNIFSSDAGRWDSGLSGDLAVWAHRDGILQFDAGNACEDGFAEVPRDQVATLRNALSDWLKDTAPKRELVEG